MSILNNYVDITGLDKYEVTTALYSASVIAPAAILHGTTGPSRLTGEQVRLADPDRTNFTFDYLGGHLMKVDLNENSFDPWYYDRNNFSGAAQAAITALRNETKVFE